MSKVTAKAPPVSQLSLFDLGGSPATAIDPSAGLAMQPQRKPATRPAGARGASVAGQEPVAAVAPAPGDAEEAVSLLDPDDPDQAHFVDCLGKALARGAVRAASAQARQDGGSPGAQVAPGEPLPSE